MDATDATDAHLHVNHVPDALVVEDHAHQIALLNLKDRLVRHATDALVVLVVARHVLDAEDVLAVLVVNLRVPVDATDAKDVGLHAMDAMDVLVVMGVAVVHHVVDVAAVMDAVDRVRDLVQTLAQQHVQIRALRAVKVRHLALS